MHGRACRQYIFRSYNTSIFKATPFDEILSRADVKKRTEWLTGFKVCIFHWPFSRDIMAVKGLIKPIYSCSAFLQQFTTPTRAARNLEYILAGEPHPTGEESSDRHLLKPLGCAHDSTHFTLLHLSSLLTLSSPDPHSCWTTCLTP